VSSVSWLGGGSHWQQTASAARVLAAFSWYSESTLSGKGNSSMLLSMQLLISQTLAAGNCLPSFACPTSSPCRTDHASHSLWMLSTKLHALPASPIAHLQAKQCSICSHCLLCAGVLGPVSGRVNLHARAQLPVHHPALCRSHTNRALVHKCEHSTHPKQQRRPQQQQQLDNC
jgi:hypothetical protein